MTRPVHFEIEVLYGTLYQPACENQRGIDAFSRTGKVEMTIDPEQVTCRKCLTALGYEAAPIEQTTLVESDPLRRAA